MEELVEKAKNGEIRALEELIKMYELILYNTARTFLKCDDDIEEAIQQTIILVYTNIYKLRNEKFFKTWLVRILINQCKKILNNQKKERIRNINIEEIENLKTTEKDDYSFITYVLNKLDEKDKEIIILYYYDDFSIREISKILGVAKGTIKSRLSRAREKMKKIINKEGLM